MDRYPYRHPAWLDFMDPEFVPAPLAGDPYFPEEVPLAPADHSEEEESSEDEEEYDPQEVAESDDEGILEGAPMDEDPEECLTEEEISTPPPSQPRTRFQPHLSGGKCPILMRTVRMSAVPMSRLETFSFRERASDIPPRFEIGESSQAPPRDIPTSLTQDDRLTDRVQSLEELLRATRTTSRAVEQRVERLEIEEKDDTEAIQTLYHRMGASRTEANNLSAHIRTLEYRVQIAENRMDAAEHRATIAEQEQRQLREQFDKLVRYLVTRLG